MKLKYAFTEMAQVSQSLWKGKGKQDAEKNHHVDTYSFLGGCKDNDCRIINNSYLFWNILIFFMKNKSVDNHDTSFRRQGSTIPQNTRSGNYSSH